MTEFWVIAAIGWICSAVVGAVIGSGKRSAPVGFLLGLFFGPLGAIAAFALDGRERCPQCKNRVDEGALTCPVCKVEISWHNGVASTEEQVAQWRKKELEWQQREQQRLEHMQAELAEFDRNLLENRKQILRFASSVVHVLTWPFRTANRWCFDLAGGDKTTHRWLVGGLILLLLFTIGSSLGIAWAFRGDGEIKKQVTVGSAGNASSGVLEDSLHGSPLVKRDSEPPAVAGQAVTRAAETPASLTDVGKPTSSPAFTHSGSNDPLGNDFGPAVSNTFDERPGEAAVEDPADRGEEPAGWSEIPVAQPAGLRRPVMAAPADKPPVENDRDEEISATDEERAEQKKRIRELEYQIRLLAQQRAATLARARRAAEISAQNDRLSAATGIPFGGSSPYGDLQNASRILDEIQRLRAEVKNLEKALR